jgi:hypothetical protein
MYLFGFITRVVTNILPATVKSNPGCRLNYPERNISHTALFLWRNHKSFLLK